MSFDTGPRHYKLPWTTPAWARDLIRLCQEIRENTEIIVATEQDLNVALDQLFSVVETLVAGLTSAPTNADGSIPGDHVQALLDKVNAERDKINAMLSQPSAPGVQASGAPTPAS